MNEIFRSWIDAPVGDVQPSVRFLVRGWCYRRDGVPVESVRVRTRNKTFAGIYGEARPDVALAFGDEPGSGCSGYQVPVALYAAENELHVEAKGPDGQWLCVETVTLKQRRSIVWRDPIKWSRFWTLAWLGRPQAWAPLNEPERDFVVARVRQRGWLNLVVGPHHTPRTIQNERYPAKRLSVDSLPRFTIVTPSLQQRSFLEQTMVSVLGQRDVQIDYIVQDGGSTDGSVDVIKRHAARLAHWESRSDEGQADAIVRGFAKVSQRPGDVMAYVNSDDVLLDGAVHFVAEYFARHPDVDVVYGHRIFIDEIGREVGRWFTPRTAVTDLRLHDFVPQETLFWRRRIWDRVGGIDRSLSFALDWDLLLRFAAAGATIARLPWFLAAFRLHAGQKTSTSLQQTGIPEMDRLRQRTLGRAAEHDELHLAMRQGELDSALIFAFWQRGWRV